MRKFAYSLMAAAVLVAFAAVSAFAYDVVSEDGVKCNYIHYDMWKGRMEGEGMLFLGMTKAENDKLYLIWGKSRFELLQKEAFLLHQPDKEKESKLPPCYQKFSDALKKAVEWEAAAEANDLSDVRKQIALGWTYNKLRKGVTGTLSKTWGPAGKNEVIEIKLTEVPRLLELLGTAPDLEKKFLNGIKKLQDDADKKKADEKAKKEKIDSVLK